MYPHRVCLVLTALAVACGETSPTTGPTSGPDLSTTAGMTSSSREVTPAQAAADPDFQTATEKIFPVTEAIYNPCVNEVPVLNGYIRVREKLILNTKTLKYTMKTWKDTRGVAASATTLSDDDHNPSTPPVPKTIPYRNRENTLDQFEVGNAGLPFESHQVSRIYLKRGVETRSLVPPEFGDDLEVDAEQSVKVSQTGVVWTRNRFKPECT